MKQDSFTQICQIAVIALILAFSISAEAFAQEDNVIAPQSSPVPKSVPESPEVRQSLPPDAGLDSDEVTILRDNYAGKYNNSSLDNLAKMYWRLGAFDLEDDAAISNYVKITDCKVFTDYIHDDMEWRKITGVMRDHLKKARDTFPLNFQFVIELHLGRYDPVRGGFDLTDKTGFRDAKRIEVDGIDADKEVCFDKKSIKDYPKSMFILLPHPFTLDFIKLDEHVAQAYILRKKSEYSKLDESLRVKRYERDAYLRLRVSFSQYDGNLRGSENELMGILYGTIDGYEVFEDSTQKRLMMSVDLEEQPAPDKTSMMSFPAPVAVDEEEPIVVSDHIPDMQQAVAIPISQSFTQ